MRLLCAATEFLEGEMKLRIVSPVNVEVDGSKNGVSRRLSAGKIS